MIPFISAKWKIQKWCNFSKLKKKKTKAFSWPHFTPPSHCLIFLLHFATKFLERITLPPVPLLQLSVEPTPTRLSPNATETALIMSQRSPQCNIQWSFLWPHPTWPAISIWPISSLHPRFPVLDVLLIALLLLQWPFPPVSFTRILRAGAPRTNLFISSLPHLLSLPRWSDPIS